ncbi:MAG: hypothetical protein BRD55_06345 [Bacteroidetes bacterium SW_9_63_38]|nr:MAG: hypothetical protein BRD55_06345 [Bacteroidetes bacterium SW_9_63_38]
MRCGENRVARLMRENGIQAKQRATFSSGPPSSARPTRITTCRWLQTGGSKSAGPPVRGRCAEPQVDL